MSGALVVNLDRRRTSIGMEEKALSTLEKFVELVEQGGIDEEDEDTESVLDSIDNDSTTGSKALGKSCTESSRGHLLIKCLSFF